MYLLLLIFIVDIIFIKSYGDKNTAIHFSPEKPFVEAYLLKTVTKNPALPPRRHFDKFHRFWFVLSISQQTQGRHFRVRVLNPQSVAQNANTGRVPLPGENHTLDSCTYPIRFDRKRMCPPEISFDNDLLSFWRQQCLIDRRWRHSTVPSFIPSETNSFLPCRSRKQVCL